jgi:hypothetical protein
MMGRPQPQEQGTGSARGLLSGRPALVAAPANLDNGRRSPRKLLRAVVARLLERKSRGKASNP